MSTAITVRSGFPGAGAHRHRHVICADEAGDVRRQIYVGAGPAPAPDHAPDIQRIADNRHIRRGAQLVHRQPGEQVMHRRVADDHRIGDLACGCADLGAQLGHQPVEGVDDPGLKDGAAVGVLVGIG